MTLEAKETRRMSRKVTLILLKLQIPSSKKHQAVTKLRLKRLIKAKLKLPKLVLSHILLTLLQRSPKQLWQKKSLSKANKLRT